MRIGSRVFELGFTAVVAASLLASCQHTAARCDIDRSEYPLQHTMSDGRSVPVHWDGNQCVLKDARAVWVRSDQGGQSCGLGYRCDRYHRGGGR